ncbi:MAG: DUF4230 domain-containing protein [Spirochaetales bacterium]|nr:DUF4230 domain-containing protein [Spirochaetales bacterium]
MKFKTYLYLALIIIIIIASFIFIPQLRNSSINPFQKTKKESVTIEDIKNIHISQFRSAEFSYNVLFPYDFLYGDPEWGTILYKNSKFLTEEDRINREFYYTCKQIGIDLAKINFFFIIKSTSTAGFDLDKYIDSNPVLGTNETTRTITLKYPKSEILSIEIDDSLREDKYPEIKITPGEWQKLINILLPEIEEKVVNNGILTSAEETNKLFINELFNSLGWDIVEFK